MTTQTINVTVCRDAVVRGRRDLHVDLSSPTNATIADGTGTGTIQNDDTAPTFSINDPTVAEGNGAGSTTFTFTVTKSGLTALARTVAYTDDPRNGGRRRACAAGIDYVTTSGT